MRFDALAALALVAATVWTPLAAQTPGYAPPSTSDCAPRDWGAGELRDGRNVPGAEVSQAFLLVTLIGAAAGDVQADLRAGKDACRLATTTFAGAPYTVFAPKTASTGPFDYWATPVSGEGTLYVFGRVGGAGPAPKAGVGQRGYVASYDGTVFAPLEIFTDRANPSLGLAIASANEHAKKGRADAAAAPRAQEDYLVDDAEFSGPPAGRAQRLAKMSNGLFRANADGSLTHLLSGAVCPPSSGPFRLAGVNVYPASQDRVERGKDVSCAYLQALGPPPYPLLVYMSFAGGLPLRIQFDTTVAFLRGAPAYYAGFGLNELATADVGGLPTMMTRLYPSTGSGLFVSDVWIGDLNPWQIKVRAQGPVAQGDLLADAGRTALLAVAKAAPREALAKPASLNQPDAAGHLKWLEPSAPQRGLWFAAAGAACRPPKGAVIPQALELSDDHIECRWSVSDGGLAIVQMNRNPRRLSLKGAQAQFMKAVPPDGGAVSRIAATMVADRQVAAWSRAPKPGDTGYSDFAVALAGEWIITGWRLTIDQPAPGGGTELVRGALEPVAAAPGP